MKEIEIASAVILNSKNELLLVQKKGSKYYQLTGGKIEDNEDKIDTLIREIEEEIGFKAKESDIDFLGIHKSIAVNETKTLVIGNIYLLKINVEFSVKIANEIENYAWLNLNNYQTYTWANLAREFVLPYCLKIWKHR